MSSAKGMIINMNIQREKLMNFDKEKLADLIIILVDRLEEEEKIRFISKYIDPQLVLESVDTGGGLHFVNEVKEFCRACHNGDYYIEPDYDMYWDSCDEEAFEGCEWAKGFTWYFNIAVMYSRNRDYNIAFEVLNQLLNCIHEAGFDENFLGTDSPEDYIETDWNDIFDQYFLCIKNCIKDKMKMINKAFEVWLEFGESCTEHILNHIEEIGMIEKTIKEKTKEINDWSSQHRNFELLKSFYEKYDKGFDKIELAECFTEYNTNFYNDVVKACMEMKEWGKAIQTINASISRVNTEEVKISLKEALVDCHENLSEFEAAFDIAKELLNETPSYNYYIRARYFAEKTNVLTLFTSKTADALSMKKDYYVPYLYIRILSYEGLGEKLIEFVNESEGYSGMIT